MRLTGVVAPVHVALRAVTDGDARSARDLAIAGESVVMCAIHQVTELIRVEVRAWPSARERDLRVLQDVAVMRKQGLTKIERRELFHPT
eukprot:2934702-Pleurochrysis_carterae.AAC.1